MNQETMKERISMNLRYYLEESEMTQVDLCNATGISEASMSRYVNGLRIPDVYTLEKIACVFNCMIDDFLRN